MFAVHLFFIALAVIFAAFIRFVFKRAARGAAPNSRQTAGQWSLEIGGFVIAMLAIHLTPDAAAAPTATTTASAVTATATAPAPASTQAADPTPAPPAPAAPTLPTDEQAFIDAVATAQRASRAAANDMQKGGIKHTRDAAVCSALQAGQGSVQDWVGTIKTIDSNSDGKGVLAISIADSITLTTWNNDLSDIDKNTLLAPGSALFTTVANMKTEQAVKFSGHFFKGQDSDCVEEQSLTLDGKLTDPDFTFKFSGVAQQ